MDVSLYLALLMNFGVDLLLLLGTWALSGIPPKIGRTVFAAALGGVYGAACLLTGFRFLGSTWWRVVALGLMGWICFGVSKAGFRHTILFAILSLALGGVAAGFGKRSFPGLLGSGIVIWMLCRFGFRGKAEPKTYTRIMLELEGKKEEVLALYDTGNTLKDPVTGEQVLVVGASVARKLLGLTQSQLEQPIETMSASKITGLRLIPYRAVGKSAGMLLGIRVHNAWVGNRQESMIVAFAPSGLDPEGTFQALIGGSL